MRSRQPPTAETRGGGRNVLAGYDSPTGTLVFTGTGGIQDFASEYETPWYTVQTSVLSVGVDEGITRIGDNAFYGLSKVEYLSLPSTLTDIGDNALFLMSSSIKYIEVAPGNPVYTVVNNCLIDKRTGTLLLGAPESDIPSDGSVTKIGKWALSSLYRTSIHIPEGVTELEESAFWLDTGVTNISLPSTLTTIGISALGGCGNSLSSLTVSPQNLNFTVSGNCLIDKAGKSVLLGTANSSIPSDGSVTKISDSAFEWLDDLTSITIPSGVTELEYSAFRDCPNLTEIYLPRSITTIGVNAFDGCYALTAANYAGSSDEWNANVKVETGNVLLEFALRFNVAPPALLGDIDGNGTVNAADRTTLARALAGWNGYTIPDASVADLDHNGSVNAADRTTLARALAGWNGYTIG